MDGTLVTLLIILAVVAGIIGFIWLLYNRLVTARMRVQESWSGIDVQLKRRSSLVPNLVETVRAYAQHEREVFENVTRARSAVMQAGDAHSAAQADNMLTGALKSLFAVAENYPQLQAAENFRELQSELSDLESKIAYARQFYNTNVMDYNTRIKVFPNVLLASNFGFTDEEFFEADDEERADVTVSFR
jgi:LemA protein